MGLKGDYSQNSGVLVSLNSLVSIYNNCITFSPLICEFLKQHETEMSSNIEKTSYLGSYIVLPVSDHTVLPSFLPFETLQLQHTPSLAVDLERNIYILIIKVTAVLL